MEKGNKESYARIIEQILEWLVLAEDQEPCDANAACLSTITKHNRPSARVVLVKVICPQNHFVFYTNHLSNKGTELQQTPYAALTFYWKTLGRQIRVEGRAEPAHEHADEYFSSRSREARIGAWASAQSKELLSRESLLKRYDDIEKRFHEEKSIPRPPYWSGFRIVPDRIEFWQEGEHRLHTRELYQETPDGWTKKLLNP